MAVAVSADMATGLAVLKAGETAQSGKVAKVYDRLESYFLKGASIPVVFGYYRLFGKDILANPVRMKLFKFISSRPYVKLSDLLDEFDLPKTTALWHLNILERGGYIKSTEDYWHFDLL